MFWIKERRRGINRIDVWYADECIKQAGIIRYREASKPLAKQFCSVRTLLSDLTRTEEEILAGFTKNCRYEIRRAPRENVEVYHYINEEITEEVCSKFVEYFADFWKSKGILDIETAKISKEIMKYAKAGHFAVTEARIGMITVVYHTYMIGDNIARLYQSASHFRTEEQIPQSVVGMANRYLHKEDMMLFRGMGKEVYDWGGAGRQDEVASITKFKESFGGKEKFFYEGEAIVGWKAKSYRKLTELIGRGMR